MGLAGSNAFGRLSSQAMSMEISTVFLNLALLCSWFDSKMCKLASTVLGLMFVVSFIALRIFFFGYGLLVQWGEFVEAPSLAPLPTPLAAFCLVLYSLGWCIQVYWLVPIGKELKAHFGKKEKKAE